MCHVTHRLICNLMTSLHYESLLFKTHVHVSAQGILQLWPYSNTLLTLQMVASVAMVYSGKYLKILNLRPLQLSSARSLFPIVFFYNANVAFALAGLQVLNIPIFNALKRLTPVLIIIGKFAIGDGIPSRQVLLSVSTIVVGCIIAGLGDLSFDPLGYFVALSSCGLQSTYLILVEKSGKEQGYNSHELLLYNAVLSLPVLSVLILCSGEGFAALSAFNEQMESSSFFLALLIFSLFLGSMLNYSLFLCTLWNSALTTTVVGAMKALVSSVLGFFVLGGVKITILVVLGVFMNTAGGIWYAALKYHQKHKAVDGAQSTSISDSIWHQSVLPTHVENVKSFSTS